MDERRLQSFFETHPHFLLGAEYKRLHSQVVMESQEGSLIPDFFLEKLDSNFADIVDLKKPNAKLVVGAKNRRGFSAALTNALNQLRVYRDFFENTARRKQFHDAYGFTAFRPS